MNERLGGIGRIGLLLGHATFIALLALAWQHTVLRCTYGDTAFQFFEWLVRPDFQVPAHRYTAAVTHVFVTTLSQAGLSLHALMVIASIVPVLVAYGIFIWCAHRWRAGAAAFACAFAAVLCTRLTFYDPVLEANWLLAFPFLFMGWAMRKDASAEWKAKDIAIAVALLVIPMNAHPAGWLLMLAIVAMLWSRGTLLKREAIISAAFIIGWTMLMAVIATPTTYERTQYELVFKGLGKLSELGSWASVQFLVDHTFRLTFTYLPAMLVALAVITGWLLRGSVKDAIVLAISAGAFKVIYLLALHAGDSGVMMDRGILPVAVIIAVSAALLIRSVGLRAWVWLLVAAVLFVKLRDVSFASRPFAERQRVVDQLIARVEEQGASKAIAPLELLDAQGVKDTWALPCETLLQSAVHGPAHSVVIMADDGTTPAPDELVVLGIPFRFMQSDERFFRPTPGPYVRLE